MTLSQIETPGSQEAISQIDGHWAGFIVEASLDVPFAKRGIVIAQSVQALGLSPDNLETAIDTKVRDGVVRRWDDPQVEVVPGEAFNSPDTEIGPFVRGAADFMRKLAEVNIPVNVKPEEAQRLQKLADEKAAQRAVELRLTYGDQLVEYIHVLAERKKREAAAA